MTKKEWLDTLPASSIDRMIEMAWEDRTPFEAIEAQFDKKEKDVIEIMRLFMTTSSFKMWRKRMKGRKTKHLQKRIATSSRFKSSLQKAVSLNKIAKR